MRTQEEIARTAAESKRVVDSSEIERRAEALVRESAARKPLGIGGNRAVPSPKEEEKVIALAPRLKATDPWEQEADELGRGKANYDAVADELCERNGVLEKKCEELEKQNEEYKARLEKCEKELASLRGLEEENGILVGRLI